LSIFKIFNPNLKKTGLKEGKEKMEGWEIKGKGIPITSFYIRNK